MSDTAIVSIEEPAFELLDRYAAETAADRERWAARIADWPDAGPREIARWHGHLIAAGWLEQNTGQLPIGYRLTAAGRRALRHRGE